MYATSFIPTVPTRVKKAFEPDALRASCKKCGYKLPAQNLPQVELASVQLRDESIYSRGAPVEMVSGFWDRLSTVRISQPAEDDGRTLLGYEYQEVLAVKCKLCGFIDYYLPFDQTLTGDSDANRT